MDTILTIILTVLLIYNVIGLAIRYFAWKQTVSETREELAEKIRVVRMETVPQQGNVILAYDEENNNFLGQGFSRDEIKTKIMNRFPQHIFIMDKEIFSAITDIKGINEPSNAR